MKNAMPGSEVAEMPRFEAWEPEQMLRTVIARVYIDGAIEYMPPSDSVHPPREGELRLVLEDDNTQYLQQFTCNQWVDLGEAKKELLKKYGLERLGAV